MEENLSKIAKHFHSSHGIGVTSVWYNYLRTNFP